MVSRLQRPEFGGGTFMVFFFICSGGRRFRRVESIRFDSIQNWLPQSLITFIILSSFMHFFASLFLSFSLVTDTMHTIEW